MLSPFWEVADDRALGAGEGCILVEESMVVELLRLCLDLDPDTEVEKSSTEVGDTRTPGARLDTPMYIASSSPIAARDPPP